MIKFFLFIIFYILVINRSKLLKNIKSKGIIKIKVFSSFCSSEDASRIFINVNELLNDPNYGEKYIFTNNEDYTHALILNKAKPNLNIPKENVIGLGFEPPKFLNLDKDYIDYVKKNIGNYLIGDKKNYGEPFKEEYSYLWHTQEDYNQKLNKNNKCSIMVSEKTDAPGHKYRHALVKKILDTDLEIDIYGRGCKYYKDDKRIKGEFEDCDLYKNYFYHICIENFSTPHYFSEKIMDPLICGCIPIYYGCQNINEYFGDSFIKLNNNVDKDIIMLKQILDNDVNIIINRKEIIEKINIKNMFKKYWNIY